MIAVDWSHTKGLTTYDGKKTVAVERKTFLKRLAGAGGESTSGVKSIMTFNPPAPSIVLEQGCPLSLIYDILKTGYAVNVISNRATQDYRVEHGIQKSDEADAKIIYELANNGAKLTPMNLNDKDIQLLELYQRYKRYQKARVAMMNMKKAYIRQFGMSNLRSSLNLGSSLNSSLAIEGEGESKLEVQSELCLNSSPSDGTLPYDICIDTLKASETSCLKKIVKLAPPVPDSLKIKGLGPRLWTGIIVTANPINFSSLSRYLRYCGLVNLEQLGHIWNRHARMLYHLLAVQVMRQSDEVFRPIYDQCKKDIAVRYPEHTKSHIHNGALNRTATFLAKEIYSKRAL